MTTILVRLTQVLVLAAGVSASLAIDWFPFNGRGLIFHLEYVPLAVLTTFAACVSGLALWRQHRMR